MAWLSPGRDARSCRAPIWVCRAPMLKSTLPFSKASARWWDGTPVRESYLGKGRVNGCPSLGPHSQMQEEPGGFSALCSHHSHHVPSLWGACFPLPPLIMHLRLQQTQLSTFTSPSFAAEAAIPLWRCDPSSLPICDALGGTGKAAPTSGRRHPGFC